MSENFCTISPHLIEAARALTKAERQSIRAQTGDAAERTHWITCARVSIQGALAALEAEEQHMRGQA